MVWFLFTSRCSPSATGSIMAVQLGARIGLRFRLHLEARLHARSVSTQPQFQTNNAPYLRTLQRKIAGVPLPQAACPKQHFSTSLASSAFVSKFFEVNEQEILQYFDRKHLSVKVGCYHLYTFPCVNDKMCRRQALTSLLLNAPCVASRHSGSHRTSTSCTLTANLAHFFAIAVALKALGMS
jgi:hypothetical protein